MSVASKNANIARHLADIAARQPGALAVAVQARRQKSGGYTYTELTAVALDEESNRYAHGLQRLGVRRGMRTVFMVTPSVEFFVLTFALFKLGAIPVIVDPGMGVRNLKKCLDEAEPEAFIGITKAHLARVLLGWARRTNRINVTVGPRLGWEGARLRDTRDEDASPILSEPKPDDTAAILFTSGSTGVPKGALYTHANFDAQVECLRRDYSIEPGERDLGTFPLFALFGPALGMASVVPMMDASKPITANPEHLFAAVRDYETTNLFASPALLDKLGRAGADEGVKLPSIKRVISAGAPTDPHILARFSKMLAPGATILPSYGATEALPVAKIGHRELIDETAMLTDQGFGVCIGRPVEGVAVRVVRITDDPIRTWEPDLSMSENEIGEICVKGPQVTRAYFRRLDATKAAKIEDPADGGFWHRMGDVGYFDGQGRLWFCGRKTHRVRAEHGDMFTIPVERIFNTHEAVRRTALVGVGSVPPQRPVLCVELNEGIAKSAWPSIRADLEAMARRHRATQSIERILRHPAFPVDVRHNAKIFREKLAEWAAERIG